MQEPRFKTFGVGCAYVVKLLQAKPVIKYPTEVEPQPNKGNLELRSIFNLI